MKKHKYIWLTIGFLIIVSIIYGYSLYPENDNYEVSRSCLVGDSVKGVDVSYYQGSIDWNLLKRSGIEFAFIRVSDGTKKVDPRFEENWRKAKNANMIRGAYQFFRPNQDPKEQAKLFLKITDEVGGIEYEDLPPVIDIETISNVSNEVAINNIGKWIKYIENNTGKTPIIYTGPYFWELNNLGSDFKTYPIWVAHYTKKGECPLIPDPWNKWTFWQFTGSGKANGVGTIVDINYYNGSLKDLLLFVNNSNKNDNIKDSDTHNDVRDCGIDSFEEEILDAKYDINDTTNDESEIYEKVEDHDGCSCNMGSTNNSDNILIGFILGFILLIIRR